MDKRDGKICPFEITYRNNNSAEILQAISHIDLEWINYITEKPVQQSS